MKVYLDFDRDKLAVEIPEKHLLKVVEMKDTPFLTNPIHLLNEKLNTSNFSKKLRSRSLKSDSVCIVVSDKTRPVPNKIILPPILEFLQNSGIKRENITILIANGMHPPLKEKEIQDLLGKDIAGKYEVINHNAYDDNSNIFLGETSNKTPIYINSTYYRASFKILTGFIEPHFMTGFSGGRKSICPGISSFKTIKVHHSPKFLESPFSAPGILEGNPCHKESLEIAKKAGVDIIVNVTLDSQKRITGIFVGDLEEAHLEGVKFCEGHITNYLNELADIVITSGGGYPLDCNFYQTVKGLVGALNIVKEGGTIIIVSGCQEGIGSDAFKKLLMEMESPEQFIEKISHPDYFVVDQWEVEELVKVWKKVKVKMFSTGLNEEEMKICHMEGIKNIEKAIKETILEYGESTKIVVIPQGPYVIPKLNERIKIC